MKQKILLLIAVLFIALTNLLMYPTMSKGGNCARCNAVGSKMGMLDGARQW